MTMRVYIAGPMTGLPDDNYPAFHAAAEKLRAAGFVVENPAENDPPADPTWENWLRIALRQMLTCDAVVLLPGWHRSKGARLESQVAEQLGLTVVDAAEAFKLAAKP